MATFNVDADVEIGFVQAPPPLDLSFPTFTVKAGGLPANQKVGLNLISNPADGTGPTPTLEYPIDIQGDGAKADADGNWTYGPQNASGLFPDGERRVVTAQVMAVVGEASATGTFSGGKPA